MLGYAFCAAVTKFLATVDSCLSLFPLLQLLSVFLVKLDQIQSGIRVSHQISLNLIILLLLFEHLLVLLALLQCFLFELLSFYFELVPLWAVDWQMHSPLSNNFLRLSVNIRFISHISHFPLVLSEFLLFLVLYHPLMTLKQSLNNILIYVTATTIRAFKIRYYNTSRNS